MIPLVPRRRARLALLAASAAALALVGETVPAARAVGAPPPPPAAAVPPGPSYRVPAIVSESASSGVSVLVPDGGTPRRLTFDARHANPDVSPDGTTIAFDNGTDVFVMRSDGSGRRALTANSGRNRQPDWSPDGGRLTFISDRLGGPEVFVMNADGSEQRTLTRTAATEGEPAWSPDGNRIAFSSYGATGGADIWATNPYGEFFTNLTASAENEHDPAWSPDGERIAFGDGGGIIVARQDGSERTRLTNGERGFRPTWSPDGRSLAFVRDFCLRLVQADDGSGPVDMSCGEDLRNPSFALLEPAPSEVAALIGRRGSAGVGPGQLAAARDDVNAATSSVVEAANARQSAVAARTNTYLSWRFLALSTRAPNREVLSFLSDTAQDVTVRYVTATGAVIVTTVPVAAETPVTVDVVTAVGAGHDLTVRVDGSHPFFAHRTTYKAGATSAPVVVAQDTGQHN